MGANTDKGLVKARKIVESVMKDLGVVPSENEVEAIAGGHAWQIARGSADVMISLVPGTKGPGRLRVVSPIVKMESGISKEMAVKLLALNGSELPGVAFGVITGDIVVLVAERSVLQLDKTEAQEILALIGYYADEYDDLLVNDFGGTRVCDLA